MILSHVNKLQSLFQKTLTMKLDYIHFKTSAVSQPQNRVCVETQLSAIRRHLPPALFKHTATLDICVYVVEAIWSKLFCSLVLKLTDFGEEIFARSLNRYTVLKFYV